MTIHIIPEPDVTLTQSEYDRYQAEYHKAFSFYAGTPPTFASWVAGRVGRELRQTLGLPVNGSGNSP